jgi:1-acyl-sn-glycerol-3-phosphate acyltransferase
MPASALSRRLSVRPGQRISLFNAPPGYLDSLQPLPEGASVTDEDAAAGDVIQVFARDRSELEREAPAALAAAKPGAALWISYLKPSDAPSSDLTRDHGWGVLHEAGLIGTDHVEVDQTWNAIRFRPLAEAGGAKAAIPPADLLPVGRRATLAYRLLRLVAVPALRLGFRFQVSGRERIPRSGTYVVIANHLGWLDALALSMVFPIEPRLHFLADPTSMIRRRFEWALVRATGGIVPVDRSLKSNQALFRHVNRCLALGGAIALFPEGDVGPREGGLLPFKKGFAHFALDSGVPVLPVAISGAKDLWLRKPIRILVGEPIQVAGKTVHEVADQGEAAVARLLPKYQDPPGRKLLRRWLTDLL